MKSRFTRYHINKEKQEKRENIEASVRIISAYIHKNDRVSNEKEDILSLFMDDYINASALDTTCIHRKMYLIVETTKGKKCLLFDEYRYMRDRIRNTTTYWRCEKAGDSCPGRAVQRGEEEPVITSPHNHDPNKEKNEILKFKSDLKCRIRDQQVPLKQLYRSELLKRYTFNPDDVCNLPQFHQIKTGLYRVKNENYPPLPRSIDDVFLEGT